VKIEEITVDKSLQARARLDQETITDHADAYKNGEEMPPIEVFEIEGDLKVVSGFHRLQALKQAGKTEVAS
jgi:hypothetical protein